MSWTIKVLNILPYPSQAFIVLYLIGLRFLASVFDTRLWQVAVVMSLGKQVHITFLINELEL